MVSFLTFGFKIPSESLHEVWSDLSTIMGKLSTRFRFISSTEQWPVISFAHFAYQNVVRKDRLWKVGSDDQSSGILHCAVSWIVPGVSNRCSAFIFGVQ